MAGADVIGPAVCIILLVVVCYVVVGSIMTTSGVIFDAQQDMTRLQEERLNTDILVTYSWLWNGDPGLPADPHELEFFIKNTGSTKINYTELNMVIITKDSPPSVIFIYSTGTGEIGSSSVGTWWFEGIYQKDDLSWTKENINLDQWDPGEFVAGWIKMNTHPDGFYVFTRNGATGSLTVSPTKR